MPLDHEEACGSEANGSKSHLYCRYCYQEGRFTHPDMSLDKMKAHIRNFMQKKNMDEMMIARTIRNLHTLGRWIGKHSLQRNEKNQELPG